MLHGCNPFAQLKDNSSQTPLHLAIENDSFMSDVVKSNCESRFCKIIASVPRKDLLRCKNVSEANLFHVAAENNRVFVLRALFEFCPEIRDTLNGVGYTALHIASHLGHVESVEFLVKCAKCDVNSKHQVLQETPLFLACKNDHHEIVEMLLRNGADLHRGYPGTGTCLHLAVKRGFEETVKVLLRFEPQLYIFDHKQRLPSELAKAKGHTKISQLLEEYWASLKSD